MGTLANIEDRAFAKMFNGLRVFTKHSLEMFDRVLNVPQNEILSGR